MQLKKRIPGGVLKGWAICVAAIFLLWAALYWRYGMAEKAALILAQQHAEDSVLAFAENTKKSFGEIDHLLLFLRRNAISDRQATIKAINFYAPIMNIRANLIGVADSTGHLTYNNLANATDPMISVTDREHFKYFSQGGADKLFVNEPIFGRASRKISIPFVRPIQDQGKFGGVVIYSADPKKFVKLFSELNLGQLGLAALIRDDGLVMARSSEMERYAGKKISTKWFDYPGAPLKGSAIRAAQTDKIKRIFSFYRLPEYGVTATVGIGVDESLTAVREDGLYSAMIGGIISLIMLLLTGIILRGVRQRSAAEAMRDQALAQMRALVSAAPIGIAMLDIELRYLDINPLLAKINGLSPEQHAGQLVSDVLPQQAAESISQAITRVINTGELVRYDMSMELPTDGGHVHHYSCINFPVRTKSCEVIGTGLLVQDVTQQKESEARILDLLNRLTVILQYAGDGIITISATGEIESCNDAVNKLFGYASEALIGRDIRLLTPQLVVGDTTAEPMSANSLRTTTGVHCGGQSVFLEIATSKVRLLAQDKFILIMRDISERERVVRLQQEFVSTVSHELRTPLTSIRGSLGLIDGGVAGVLPEKMRPLIHIANLNAERLARLIDDLLDLQKLESGALPMTSSKCSLPHLINEARHANASFAERLGVRIIIVGDIPEVPLYVDPNRFEQVMANLLSNACKFSENGGVIEVSSVMLSPDRVRIMVKDSGPGIPEAFKLRIFQKFSQADASNARHKGGSGLGLAIAKELIHEMHGLLDYESTPGQGCCFYFELPVVPEAPDPVACAGDDGKDCDQGDGDNGDTRWG